MYANFLDEDFEISDNRENGVNKALTIISNSTVYKVINPSGITIFSLTSRRSDDSFDLIKINPDYADEKIILPSNPQQIYFAPSRGNRGTMSVDKLKKWGITDKQISEIRERGYFLQYHEKSTVITLIPSKAFLATLCRQIGCGKLEEGIEPLRDIYLASKLRDAEPFMLVYRTNGRIGKAFGCFSTSFSHNPQTIVYDFKAELSKISPVAIRGWRINHFVTKIDFMFAEMSQRIGGLKMVPGVRLTMSDVGDASYSLQNTIYLNGGMVIFNKAVSKRHVGVLNVSEMTAIYESQINDECTFVFDRLKEMENHSVDDVKESVLKALKSIGFGPAYGVQNAAKFKKKHVNNLSASKGTRLDVVKFLMKIPGLIRNHTSPALYENVAETVGKALKA